MDGPATLSTQWQRELDFFHAVDIEEGMTITDLIQKYRQDGRLVSIPRTSIPAITILTQAYLKVLADRKSVSTRKKDETGVNHLRSIYELLIDKPDDYKVIFPMNSPENTRDIVDSFNYVKLQPRVVAIQS